MIDKQRPQSKSRIVPMLLFLVLVFIVAVGGTFLALQMFGGGSEGRANVVPEVVTVAIVITTTPNPSPQVIVVTATNQPGTQQVDLPTGLDVASGVSGAQPAGATLDATALGASGAGVDSSALAQAAGGTALPENCIIHIIVEGDTPFGIAEQYGANPFLMLEANNLTEETSSLLQIGDELLVPLEGCPVELPPTETPSPTPSDTPDPDTITLTPEETEEPTLEFTPTITPSPTITLAPTAANAQIEIVDVEGIGDITAEGIRLRNTGNTINVTGWTLTDANDNEFSFPEQLLFSNAEVTIYTRSGTNTPVALFWGLDEPIWEEGDVLTLSDSTNQIQATIRLPEEIDLE